MAGGGRGDGGEGSWRKYVDHGMSFLLLQCSPRDDINVYNASKKRKKINFVITPSLSEHIFNTKKIYA
jgi:hypothetical protein